MKISEKTISELVVIIVGKHGFSRGRSYSEVKEFFKEFEEIDSDQSYLPINLWEYTQYKIEEINGTSNLLKLFDKVLHPKYYYFNEQPIEDTSLKKVVQHLNKFLELDNYKIVKIKQYYKVQNNQDITVQTVLHRNENEIVELIKQGESSILEFKSSARWNLNENKQDKIMEKVILKTVAAFLNSEGGTLLIGIANDGKVVGLQHDYKTLKQPNQDGYEQFLAQLLLRDNFGLDLSSHVKFSFHTIELKEICEVKISKSPKPVYLEEQFWIRSGNSTQQLPTSKIYDYCKNRFG
jgi:Predicted transcriptional regulator containing an HTH domain and an uncharacterized domain shared with the mammalian protein Schlafen